MKIAVNCTSIDTSRTLGVLRFGQRLAKALRNAATVEVVGLVPREYMTDPAFLETFERVILPSQRRTDAEAFDAELLLHHFQTPCTRAAKAMILHDLHLWDVPWKYSDLTRRKETLESAARDMDAIMVHFPRTYYDLPKVMPELHNRLFLTIIPPMIEYVEEDTASTLEIRTKYGISGDQQVLLYPAQLQPHKNHLNLFRAIKTLEKSPIRLICTGSELQKDHAAKLHRSISELGLEERIVMTGRIDDHELESMYHIADLIVFASMAESGATIAEEAILYGKKIVYPDVRPSRLHLEKMRASIPLFNPLDPEDIAQTITSALDTPQDNTRARAIIQSWTWDRLADQYRNVLNWLKAGRPIGEMPLFLDDSLGYLRRP